MRKRLRSCSYRDKRATLHLETDKVKGLASASGPRVARTSACFSRQKK